MKCYWKLNLQVISYQVIEILLLCLWRPFCIRNFIYVENKLDKLNMYRIPLYYFLREKKIVKKPQISLVYRQSLIFLRNIEMFLNVREVLYNSIKMRID